MTNKQMFFLLCAFLSSFLAGAIVGKITIMNSNNYKCVRVK